MSPTVSIKDRTVDWPVVIENFEYNPHAVVSLTYSYSDTGERLTAYWEWKDGESSVYPPYGSEMTGKHLDRL